MLPSGADDRTVKVVGDTHFGRQHQTREKRGVNHQPVADAFAIKHGEGELIAWGTLIEVKAGIVAVGMEIAEACVCLDATHFPAYPLAQHKSPVRTVVVGMGKVGLR